ncbi:MAG: putative oxidoreductase, contains short-chain dehydrogenase (SDR) and DUF2520 domains [Chloroflexi bacterium]|nr:MAG: putative oxidoreductase, contains short-chain dehydrogenase (SDR) and DUF2520 domains [Chloroflexota bacterium]
MRVKFERVGFLGSGRMGSALSLAMFNAGYEIEMIASRSLAAASSLASQIVGCKATDNFADLQERCDLIFLTVPDHAITGIVSDFQWRKGQAVIHCSGVLGTEVLENARVLGAYVGAVHPLQTFCGNMCDSEHLLGSTFTVSSDAGLHDWIIRLVETLKGKIVSISAEDRPLYHASAVMVCGYLTTLLEGAIQMWAAMGFDSNEAIDALFPLIQSTLRNIEMDGLERSVTGPIPREDFDTIRLHLGAIRKRTPQLLPLYSTLGLAMVDLVSRLSGTEDQHRAMWHDVLVGKMGSDSA